MKSCLPTVQGRNKWKALQKNLAVGQLVLVGDAKDLSHGRAYRLGRIYFLHSETRNRQIVCRATVAVMGKASKARTARIEYVLRDLSKMYNFCVSLRLVLDVE